MKKNTLLKSLCLVLAIGLTACGSSDSDISSESTQVESTSETSEESEVTKTSSASETEDAEEETESTSGDEDEDEDADETDETSEQTSTVASADIADAIYGADTTDESAIPLGQWGMITRRATADKLYHTVYVRITNVTSYADDADYVQAAIDLNNENSYDWGQIDLSDDDYALPSDVQWHLLEYEIYVPESFPSDDGTIIEPSINLWAQNIGGGGIPSADGTATYIGLGSPIDLESYSSDTEFIPGNTYSFNVLFSMVDGYEDYVFYNTFYEDGTDEGMLYAYFACK